MVANSSLLFAPYSLLHEKKRKAKCKSQTTDNRQLTTQSNAG